MKTYVVWLVRTRGSVYSLREMSRASDKLLSPDEELSFLKELYGGDSNDRILTLLMDDFQVLQNRAQILLSLGVVCLTITGFSGRQIVQACRYAGFPLGAGVLSVLLSALVLFSGPLRVQWLSRTRAGTMDQTIVDWISRRNRRTRRYHLAVLFLVVGLSCYVLALSAYLFGSVIAP